MGDDYFAAHMRELSPFFLPPALHLVVILQPKIERKWKKEA